MKAKVATSVVRDVAGTGSNSGASEGKKGRASPALREAAASGGTGGARTQEMTVGGADDADDEGQSVGRHEGMEAATIIVASLETMAAALQDLMAIVMDNVVKGMENISQSWATAPNPFPVPMAVTTGQTMVIPGVGNPDLAGYVAGEGGLMAGSDSAWVLCTNPRGVFNRCGRKAETSSTEAPKVKAEVRKKARVLVVQEDSGESTEEEEDEPAARKKSAGAVRQVASERGREGKPADPASKCFLCCSGEH
ncbi:hypothetical protein PF002_g18873 [Phytophthora fragariae]|uniref:Uncharacterized protein n=1 Tax=Phytophthora fragariae TaxID=53985 RepID=A0A6A3Y0G1_9STRA|nr:hypothetical protein PF002_g18873 [Phytophthora fragariae]